MSGTRAGKQFAKQRVRWCRPMAGSRGRRRPRSRLRESGARVLQAVCGKRSVGVLLLESGGFANRRGLESNAATGNALRMAGTFPVTAQSPNETRVRRALANQRILCSSSSVLTEPSTRLMSTCSRKNLVVDDRAVDQVELLAELDQCVRPYRETTCGSRSSRRARRWRAFVLLIGWPPAFR